MTLRNHNWRTVLDFFKDMKFEVRTQKGSHMQLDDDLGHRVTLPRHSRLPVPVGTLKSMLNQAGISQDTFRRWVKRRKRLS